MRNWKDYLSGKYFNIKNLCVFIFIFRYLVGKKSVGKDLHPLISKAVNFINNDVKGHLGIKVGSPSPRKIRSGEINNQGSGNESSILGG